MVDSWMLALVALPDNLHLLLLRLFLYLFIVVFQVDLENQVKGVDQTHERCLDNITELKAHITAEQVGQSVSI